MGGNGQERSGVGAGFAIVLINAMFAGIGGLWVATGSVPVTLFSTVAIVALAVSAIVLHRDPGAKKVSGGLHDPAAASALGDEGRAAPHRSGEDSLAISGAADEADDDEAPVAGVPDWFEGFYRDQYRNLVRAAGWALASGGLEEQAADVVAEVFLKAIKNGTWPQEGAAPAYFRIAMRRAGHSRVRRHRDEEPLDGRDFGSGADVPSTLAGEAWVRSVLDLLPPAQREVMYLTYDGLSGPEIAVLLGKSEPTVRSLKRLARVRLITLVGSSENSEPDGPLGEE